MLKKIIALSLICAMLVPLSPVVAADETTVTPTIEEILNSYHNKAFEAQSAEKNGGASTYARGGSNQTLEQETVNELTEAGYEAHNVTGENYEALEDALNTDFAAMGLNPASSYVVVIDGSEQGEHASSAGSSGARVYQPPLYEGIDGNASESCYTYSYGGRSYTMRRILVTAADDSNYSTCKDVNLVDLLDENSAFVDTLENLSNFAISTLIDKYTDSYLGTVMDLFGFNFVDIDPSQNCILDFYAGLSRIRSYTQIYESSTQEWKSWYSAEAATLTTCYSGMYYSRSLNRYTTINQSENVYSLNSNYYYDYEQQNEQAVLNRALPGLTFDNIGTVQILLKNMNTSRYIEVLSFAPYFGDTP